jgi:hypothetical protein
VLHSSPRGRRARACLVLLALGLAAGCGGSHLGKVVPVEGTVTVDDKLLPGGMVSFLPDEAKGNKVAVAAVGKVEEGKFTLTTDGKAGAPVGWYKVVVSNMTPGEGAVKPGEAVNPTGPGRGMPAMAPAPFNPRYTLPDKTTLYVEVVESPGPDAYDLKLTAR